MSIDAIIAVILRTPALSGTTIELAALAARTGKSNAVSDVARWWVGQGGTVTSDVAGAEVA